MLIWICILGFDGDAARDLSPLTHVKAASNEGSNEGSKERSDGSGGGGGSGGSPLWYLLVAQYELPTLRALSRQLGDGLRLLGCRVEHLEVTGTMFKALHFTAINEVEPVLARVRAQLDDGSDGGKLVEGKQVTRMKAVAATEAAQAAQAATEAEADDDDDGDASLCAMSVADSTFFLIDFAVTAVVELAQGAPPLSTSDVQRLCSASGHVHSVLRARALRLGSTIYWQPERVFRPSRHASVASANSLDEALAHEARTPLPLDRPLWRVAYVRLPRQQHALILTIHHCVGDGAFIATAMLKPLLGVIPPTPPPTARRKRFEEERFKPEEAGGGGGRLDTSDGSDAPPLLRRLLLATPLGAARRVVYSFVRLLQEAAWLPYQPLACNCACARNPELAAHAPCARCTFML